LKARLLILLFLLSTVGLAQGAPVMVKGTTSGLSSFIAVDAAQNAIVAAGISNGTGIGDFDIVLVALSAEGKVLWEKAYGDTGRDLVSSVKVLPDGSVLVAGGSASFNGGWIFLVDKNGNLVWSKVYPTGMIYSALPYGDGILALSSANEKPLLLKLASKGLVEHAYLLNTSLNVVPVSMEILPGQGIYIAGIANSSSTSSLDFWLAKVDESGNILWERTYGFEGMDMLYDIELDGRGITLVGYTTFFNNETNVNLFVVRTDLNGRLLWARIVGGPGEDWANAVSLLPSGKLALGGITYSIPNPQAWLLFMDIYGTTGESLLIGSEGVDWIRSLAPLPSGGMVFVGSLNGTGLETGSIGGSSFFLGTFREGESFAGCHVSVHRLDFPVEGATPVTWVSSGGKAIPVSVSARDAVPKVKTITGGFEALCPLENPDTTSTMTTTSHTTGTTTTKTTTATTTTTTTGSATTTTSTIPSTTTTSKNDGWKLCGPGLLVALSLSALLFWRKSR